MSTSTVFTSFTSILKRDNVIMCPFMLLGVEKKKNLSKSNVNKAVQTL